MGIKELLKEHVRVLESQRVLANKLVLLAKGHTDVKVTYLVNQIEAQMGFQGRNPLVGVLIEKLFCLLEE